MASVVHRPFKKYLSVKVTHVYDHTHQIDEVLPTLAMASTCLKPANRSAAMCKVTHQQQIQHSGHQRWLVQSPQRVEFLHKDHIGSRAGSAAGIIVVQWTPQRNMH